MRIMVLDGTIDKRQLRIWQMVMLGPGQRK
jgi:hypothetical protein